MVEKTKANMNKESSLELSFYMVRSKVVCTNKRSLLCERRVDILKLVDC